MSRELEVALRRFRAADEQHRRATEAEIMAERARNDAWQQVLALGYPGDFIDALSGLGEPKGERE